MYRATDIAKWFINKGIEEKCPLTPMQVLKLTYIAQGTHLATFNEGLFGESCEAWRYGPVVSIVYQKTKDYGKTPINKDIFPDRPGINPEDKDTQKILESVWKTFGKFSALELSEWTHREGSAWDIAYNQEKGKNYLGYDISADLLKKEFSELLKENYKGAVRENRPGW